MEAFATVEQLEAGWRALSEDEQAVASELLDRASAQLASMLSQKGIAIVDGDEVQQLNLCTAVCNMVRRSMASYGAEGVQTMQQSIGSTSASVTWSNPDGAFYLSKNDKIALGLLGSGGYRSVRARTFADGEAV